MVEGVFCLMTCFFVRLCCPNCRFKMAPVCDAVVRELFKINCCSLCVLRFLNEKRPQAYFDPGNYISQHVENNVCDGEPSSKIQKKNPCSGCLGLLQPEAIEQSLEKIISSVTEAGYDADEVTFALSLPISLMLRNFSIWLHISDQFAEQLFERQILSNNPDSFKLRIADNVVSIKEAWKILVAPELAEKIGKKLNNGVDSKFFVNVFFEYPADEMETSCMFQMHHETFGHRKNQKRKYHNDIFTRKSVEGALEKTSRDLFEQHCSIPPEIPTDFISCNNVVCSHDSLYIAGRYNKYSRSLSQTPWLINGERRMENSVEEIIKTPIGRYIPHDVIKFSSSGREDVDVRTLGLGRPFVLDVQNPRKTKLSYDELRVFENEINESGASSVFVRYLQVVPKDDLVHIKTGERMKTKTYNCLCVVRGTKDEETQSLLKETLVEKLHILSNGDAFVIQQKTPVRVLHRRPLATRPRTIHWIKGAVTKTVGENIFFELKIKVEAGTYIKELVHGDLGRTVPNISEKLELEADIVALDVEEVDLPWPPPVTNKDKIET